MNKLIVSLLISLVPLVSLAESKRPVKPAAVKPNATARFHEIAERYFQDGLALNPLSGSQITGDEKYEDKLEVGITPEFKAKAKALLVSTDRELKSVNRAALKAADQVSYDLLKEEIRDRLEGMTFPSELMPIDQFGALPVYVAQFGSGQQIQPLKTVKNYQNYLKRLEVLPQWATQAEINMREGMKRGIVRPKALISSGLPAFKALGEKEVEKSPFWTAIKVMPASFTAAEKEAVTAAYREAIEKRLQPAFAKFAEFVEKDYLPACVDKSGRDAIPGGKDWYAYSVRHYTTTNMTPEQIHALGLKEVARIRAEMAKIQAHYKHAGTLTEFLKWADEAPQFRPFKTEKEVLDVYASLNETIKSKLPEYFGRSPKAPLEIRPEPELTKATASDHYSSPATDGSRPGVFYAVIMDPAKYNTTGMATLMIHEGQPGHHYHIALQQELPLPNFRKHGWFTAYGEGWALYAETLGHEFGFYKEPHYYLGHLNDELLRAVRLVTDTGLHYKGWTREQTIQYMMDMQGYSEHESKRATERYMAWPGQALAYKIGSLKIQELRERASKKLGKKFSLRDFHDLVLFDGALPLTVLEKQVDAWIAARLKGK
ncbi:MAG: DUF885 domain-containing protein [Betaproteobacteria bacterium]|nr:DUF885 domain-containing protein [Betaproteobacteria bacterium]